MLLYRIAHLFKQMNNKPKQIDWGRYKYMKSQTTKVLKQDFFPHSFFSLFSTAT